MELRRIELEEIKDLQSICKEVYSINFGDHWEPGGLELYLEEQFGDERMKKDLANDQILYYLMKEGEAAIGFVKVNLDAELEGFSEIDCCELEKIYLLPNQKGKGLGRKAINAVMDRLKAKGKKLLFLCVIDSNQAAMKFYEALGFEYHSRIRLEAPFFKEELRGMHRMLIYI
ncbi:MAG: GNAT family N-acetyltransferase [Bacteroidota bacterium]